MRLRRPVRGNPPETGRGAKRPPEFARPRRPPRVRSRLSCVARRPRRRHRTGRECSMIPKSPLPRTLTLGLMLLAGCNRPAATPGAASKTQADPAEALTDTVSQAFLKSGDAKSFRQLVEHLNSSLSGGAIERKPQPLTADQRAALKAECGLPDT